MTSQGRETLTTGSRRKPATRDQCPTCRQERVTVVAMELGDGSTVELHACGHCESRTWIRDGTEVPTDQVIGTLRQTGGSSRRSRGRRLP